MTDGDYYVFSELLQIIDKHGLNLEEAELEDDQRAATVLRYARAQLSKYEYRKEVARLRREKA